MLFCDDKLQINFAWSITICYVLFSGRLTEEHSVHLLHQEGEEGQDNTIITNGSQEGVINLAVATTQEDHNRIVAIVVPGEGEVRHFVATVVAGIRSGGGHTNSNN